MYLLFDTCCDIRNFSVVRNELGCLVLIFSSMLLLVSVCGSHTAAHYSNVGRPSALKAVSFVCCVQPSKFLIRKPSIQIALC